MRRSSHLIFPLKGGLASAALMMELGAASGPKVEGGKMTPSFMPVTLGVWVEKRAVRPSAENAAWASPEVGAASRRMARAAITSG